MDLSKMSVEQLRELGGCLILPAAFDEIARRLAAIHKHWQEQNDA